MESVAAYRTAPVVREGDTHSRPRDPAMPWAVPRWLCGDGCPCARGCMHVTTPASEAPYLYGSTCPHMSFECVPWCGVFAQEVLGLDHERIVSISAGENHSLVITKRV